MVTKIYYHLKPMIPRALQIHVRRKYVARKRPKCAGIWPIDESAGTPPAWWKGWPEKKRFALVLTHDVDTAKGQKKCGDLIRVEKEAGFRSSFNFIPERYKVSPELRDYLMRNGFEVGVHDLYHDGKLYSSKKEFAKRAEKINRYLKEWDSVGFRSGSMMCNLRWIRSLDIEYDASTFDTDPFEPRPYGTGTIFPFRVVGNHGRKGYIELPYTLPQDFTLFVLMREKSIDVWKKKLDWIVECGGMALLNTHPDYMCFGSTGAGNEEYPYKYYEEFLMYIKTGYEGQCWHVLPRELAGFFQESMPADTKNQ
jgi:hypothetical protein